MNGQFVPNFLKLGLTISTKRLKNIGKPVRQGLIRLFLSQGLRLPLAFIALAAALLAAVDWEATPETVAGWAEIRDGDSLVIGRHRVRLQGIDAPERAQTCKRYRKTWACGRAAERHLAGLIARRRVACAVVRRDRFERLLARCRAGNRDLNRQMVRDGMAVSFGRTYRDEEAAARRGKKGIWSGEFMRPQAWRRAHQRR